MHTKRSAALCLASLCLLAGNAHAQSEKEQEKEQEKPFRTSLGAGVVSLPEYPGSDRRKTRLAPLFSLSYGRFFVGADAQGGSGTGPGTAAGIGFNAYESGGFRLGGLLGADFRSPRAEGDDERLRGLGDIGRTVRAGVFASYAKDWLILRASATSDVAGHHQGTLARLDVLGRYAPFERLTLSAGPGLTWASAQREQTFFGIDADQSARSGRPQYAAGSGIESLRFSVAARYLIGTRWSVAATFSAARLQGDAAASPITQSKSQNIFGVFTSYRF
jgi:outer membrane protein